MLLPLLLLVLQMHKCPNTASCELSGSSYDRSGALQAWWAARANFSQEELMADRASYIQLQCSEGYTGRL